MGHRMSQLASKFLNQEGKLKIDHVTYLLTHHIKFSENSLNVVEYLSSDTFPKFLAHYKYEHDDPEKVSEKIPPTPSEMGFASLSRATFSAYFRVALQYLCNEFSKVVEKISKVDGKKKKKFRVGSKNSSK